MKALILAAGRGTRLNKYTDKLPKGMLMFDGKTLIERQISVCRNAGIADIVVVTGYMAEKINYDNIKIYHNPDFATTNMLESLFCAENELNDDIIVSYADIIYEKQLLDGLINCPGEIVVTVDINWKKYWQARYGTVDFDLESLKIIGNEIISLGTEVKNSNEIDARYVGLLKFSKKGLQNLKSIYHKNKAKYWNTPWQVSGKTFSNAYMTDMLNEMIKEQVLLKAHKVSNGWLEFDTNEDYERMVGLLQNGQLNNLIKL